MNSDHKPSDTPAVCHCSVSSDPVGYPPCAGDLLSIPAQLCRPARGTLRSFAAQFSCHRQPPLLSLAQLCSASFLFGQIPLRPEGIRWLPGVSTPGRKPLRFKACLTCSAFSSARCPFAFLSDPNRDRKRAVPFHPSPERESESRRGDSRIHPAPTKPCKHKTRSRHFGRRKPLWFKACLTCSAFRLPSRLIRTATISERCRLIRALSASRRVAREGEAPAEPPSSLPVGHTKVARRFNAWNESSPYRIGIGWKQDDRPANWTCEMELRNWPPRTRTLTSRSRVCCATITLGAKKALRSAFCKSMAI